MEPIPPESLTTPHLLLRCWDPYDAPLLDRALDVSWEDLQRWIPWAFPRRESEEELRARLEGYRDDFLEGRDALYGVFDAEGTEVVGGAGLHRRIGPGALEIGYWIRSDRAGRGYATEAAAALVRAGLALPGIERLEIRCEPHHHASIAVARKLGFRHRETLTGACVPAGDDRATMIWELKRDDASPAASPP